MNRAETIGTSSVRDRAQRYAQSRPRYVRDFDESADAVPLKKRHAHADTTAASPPPRKASANPYRVRDRMASESAKRAAADALRPPQRKTGSQRAKTNTGTPPHGAVYGKARTGAAPDSRYNTDAIFRDDSLSDAQRVAAYRRAVRRKMLTRMRRALAALLIVAVFALCAFALVYKTVYVIHDVSVDGTSRYTPEEIAKASGVSAGINLYSFSSRIAEENVTLYCPYVRTLSVSRIVPDRVLLTVSEDTAVFYTELYGELRALSSSLRVLDCVSESDAAAAGLIRLRLPAVDCAVAGRVLSFENDRNTRAIREVLSAALSSGLHSRITSIDFRTPHTLKMVCDHQYLLQFGNMENVETKLKVADAVMKDSLFSSAVRAEIDLTSSGETSVILDNQLDLES